MANLNMGAISDKCRKWSKTSRGKKVMDDVAYSIVRGKARPSGAGSSSSGSFLTIPEMVEMAKKLKSEIVFASMSVPPSVHNSINTLHISEIEESPQGEISIKMSFDKNAIGRPSLYPKKYPGMSVDNIVALFNNGYSAGGRVYGYWRSHGVRVPSKTDRAPLYFMQNGVANFLASYGTKYDIKVGLNSLYN